MFEITANHGERLLIVGEQQGYRYKITQHCSKRLYSLYIWDKLFFECDTLLGIENRLRAIKNEDNRNANDRSTKTRRSKVSERSNRKTVTN